MLYSSPLPPPVSYGFTAGILRVAWIREPPATVTGRPECRLQVAHIVECHSRTETLPRDLVNTALIGLIVRSPDGALSRIIGVESPVTMGLGVGSNLGILLSPVDER